MISSKVIAFCLHNYIYRTEVILYHYLYVYPLHRLFATKDNSAQYKIYTRTGDKGLILSIELYLYVHVVLATIKTFGNTNLYMHSKWVK